MIRRKTGIQIFLILLFLLHLIVCPALHEIQDFKETEIFSSDQIFENPHHDHSVANRESQFHHFHLLGSSIFVMPPPAPNPIAKEAHDFLPSLSPVQQATILRC